MISKKEIIFFIALFAAGIIGAWKFVDHLKAINKDKKQYLNLYQLLIIFLILTKYLLNIIYLITLMKKHIYAV